MADPADLSPVAEEILVVLQRSGGLAVEPGELGDQVPFETEEIRVGLRELVEIGKVEEVDDGWILAGETGASTSAEEGPEESGGGPPASPSGSSSLPSRDGGATYRAGYTVSLTYGRSSGGDEAALASATQALGEIQGALEEAGLPVADVHLEAVAAYDSPRPVFPAKDAEEPD